MRITALGKEWDPPSFGFLCILKRWEGGWWETVCSSVGPVKRTPLVTSALLGVGKIKPGWVGTGAGEGLAAKLGLWSNMVSRQTGQTPDTGQHRRKHVWEEMSLRIKPEGNLESNVSLALAWIQVLGTRLASHWQQLWEHFQGPDSKNREPFY